MPWTLAGAIALAGIGSAVAESQKTKRPVWPAPPDQARFQYEYTLRTYGDVIVKKETPSLKSLVVGDPDRSSEWIFQKPAAIASRQGRMYVADTMKNMMVILDIPRRRIYPFGVRDDGGKLAKPVAVALDGKLDVYVVDAGGKKVNVYDKLGLYLRSVGSGKELERPTGVAVDPSGERIYVVDRSSLENNSPRVICYDRDGKTLFTIGKPGEGPGEFHIPLQAAVGKDNRLYVLDSGNFRVQAFDRDGNYLFSIGELGDTPGTFARPRGLSVDDDGLIYVSDATFGNVQIFNPEGQLLLVVGGYQNDNKDSPGNFSLVNGLAVDETKRLYVVDQYFRKIEVIRRLSDEEGKQMQEGLK